jgi:hypothetical protein
MSNVKAVPVAEGDPAAAALDRAAPLDEKLTPDEEDEIERRIAAGISGIASDELLSRLRPKP